MKLKPWGYVGDDGIARLGRDLESPDVLEWDDAERRCSGCRMPTHWRTQRGRPIHPTCDPRAAHDRLSVLAELDLEDMACRVLSVRSVELDYRPPGRRPREVAYLGEPCGICFSTVQTLACVIVQPYRSPIESVRCKQHMTGA